MTAVIFRKATHRTTLEKRSVKTRMYLLRDKDLGRGPRMSTLTSVNGSVDGKSLIGAVWRRNASRLCAQAAHLVTTP